MASRDTVVFITSLAPRAERTLQTAAIASWEAAGFSCCAVNTEAEQAILRHDFPDLTFLTPPRTAESAAGKPVPFIHDMLALAGTAFPDADAFGVINDDIILRADIPLRHGLTDLLQNSMILGPRVDIDALGQASAYQDVPNPTFSTGYDLIILPRDKALHLPPAPLAMGMPFWDYWLPITAIWEGWPVRVISDQALLHVAHDTVWDDTVFMFFHALATSVLQGLQTQKPKEHDRFALAVDLLTQVYADTFEAATGETAGAAQRDALSRLYDRIQEVLVHHIKAAACPITLRSGDA